MSTTLIFAEILIIGVQAIVWIAMLVLAIFGVDIVASQQLKDLSQWEVVLAVVALALAYTLGIIVDRIADALFFGWTERIKGGIFGAKSNSTRAILIEATKDNEYLQQQFEYNRSRLRIVRASSLNFGLIGLGTAMLFVLRPSIVSANVFPGVIGALVVGVLLVAGSVFAWHRLTVAFYQSLKYSRDQRLK